MMRQFRRDLKKLARKYPAIIGEVRKLIQQIENDERPSDIIPNVGYDVYKVRLANPSVQKGKSGGFCAIYYVKLQDEVVLLTLYAKNDQTDVTIKKNSTNPRRAI